MALPLVWDMAKVQEYIRYAEEHPLPLARVKAAVQGVCFDQEAIKPYQYSLVVNVVGNAEEVSEIITAVVTFTIEEHSPGNWFKHFSILPSYQPFIVQLLAKDYGVDMTDPEAAAWLDHAKSVNVVVPFKDYKPPSLRN